jgi:hypothetical protein
MSRVLPESTIDIVIKQAKPKPTIVYESYWHFAAERQKVYYRRVRREPSPWTEDPILSSYKFTNAYRASDRVSQYLIKYVIYNTKHSLKDLLFRILLFKTFNKIETWEALEEEFGAINTQTYTFDAYDRMLSHLSETGKKIYSGAYIMASGSQVFGSHKKHRNHLKLIESIIADNLHEKIPLMKSMKQLYEALLSYPTIGNFLAYQYTIDINYSELCSFSEMDYVVPGPGARDGIKKCFHDFGGLTEEGIIKYVTERQETEFKTRGLEFETLGDRLLQLIDCQNLFCEVDKYARVAHPELAGLSGRKRIKQRFIQKSNVISPWYPPKWGINEYIMSHTSMS